MHTDETAVTIQRHKIVSNEVEDYFSAALFAAAKTRTRPERPRADGQRRCHGASRALRWSPGDAGDTVCIPGPGTKIPQAVE